MEGNQPNEIRATKERKGLSLSKSLILYQLLDKWLVYIQKDFLTNCPSFLKEFPTANFLFCSLAKIKIMQDTYLPVSDTAV